MDISTIPLISVVALIAGGGVGLLLGGIAVWERLNS